MCFSHGINGLFKLSLLSLITIVFFGCVSIAKPPLAPAVPEHQEMIASAITTNKSQQIKVALVLGSGGARGYAHIGAIQILERYGIKPDFIVGTSAGSIIGALYASGKNADELERLAMDLKPSDVRDFTLSTQGFFDGKKIEDYVNQTIQHRMLENLDIPLYVVATELKTGNPIVFKEGNTGQAVRASTTIPSMFVPTKIGENEYVDGGLVSPLPVEIAKQLGADMIIAVDILARPEYTETTNLWGLFNQNINVMQNRLAENEAKLADILIRPDIREKQHVFSTKSRENTIFAGQQAAIAQIPQIRLILEQKKAAQVFKYLESK